MRNGELDLGLDPPRHIVAEPAAARTLCGLCVKTDAALPYLAAQYVDTYRATAEEDGRTFRLCPDCAEVRT